MTELEIKIKEAANAYYKDGSSPYTDEEFDEMMEELRETQPNSELLKNGVPEDEARKILEIKDLYLPEKKDDRYIADYGKMFMTNPECAMNYPLK